MTDRQPLARDVWAVAAGLGLLLLATSGRYGYHRDELYFLAAGHHLAWGYPDQPVVTPLLARLMSEIAPHSLVVLRLPSTLSAAAVVLLTGRMAADLGARRGGQVFAAGCAAITGVVLATGHLLSTTTTSILGWTLVTWLLVRLLRGGHATLWLVLGVVAGITMLANVLLAALLAALLLALLAIGPREVLRSPWPWAGAVIALVLVSPYLIWQASHDWPQLAVAGNIASGGSGTSAPRVLFLPMQLAMVGPWLTPVWVLGLIRLFRDRALGSLALAYLILCVGFIAIGGKPYYVAGLYPLLLAAGAQPFLDRFPRIRPLLLLALSTPVLVFTLPLLPSSAAGPILPLNYDAGETIGWPEYVAQIDAVVREQPPKTRVLTSNYGEAGAVDRYGPALGMQPALSGHNGYGLWGPPPAEATTVVAVGLPEDLLHKAFLTVRRAGTLRNREGIDNDEQGAALFVCTGPRDSWARLWPHFVHNG